MKKCNIFILGQKFMDMKIRHGYENKNTEKS